MTTKIILLLGLVFLIPVGLANAQQGGSSWGPGQIPYTDQQWDPPSSPQGAFNKCLEMVENAGGNAMMVCNQMAQACGGLQLSYIECYAANMVPPDEVPFEVQQMVAPKLNRAQQLAQGGGVPQQFQQGQGQGGGGGQIDQFTQQQLPSGGTGSLNDACLQSGFTQQQCNSYIGSSNPGGYCTTLQAAGLPCPQIQDPSFTYNNPEAAKRESESKIQQGDAAIQGFDRLYPKGDLGSGFADD